MLILPLVTALVVQSDTPPITVEAVQQETVTETSRTKSIDDFAFLSGTWESRTELLPAAFGAHAGFTAGVVVASFGPHDAWFEMEARIPIGDEPYAVRVLVHPGRGPGDFTAYVVNTLGGAATYHGRFTNDTTLEFRGTLARGVVQRVRYFDQASGNVRFVVDESSDGGITFTKHSDALWSGRRASSDTQSDAQNGITERVVNFEIRAHEPRRAMRFYQQVFGWSFVPDTANEYWEVKTGPAHVPGIDGGLLRRDETGFHSVWVVYVENIDATIAKVVGAGGTVVVPRMAIPGVGWQAYLLDSEQNSFALFMNDSSAR